MARKGHSEEQILRVLREAESGETVVEVCRRHGISQQSFHLWKKYAELGLSELRSLSDSSSSKAAGKIGFPYGLEQMEIGPDGILAN